MNTAVLLATFLFFRYVDVGLDSFFMFKGFRL